MNEAARIFEDQRPQLTAICYQMLGEKTGAEDAVQDTWLRWSRMDHREIRNPAAWLRRTATNIAIDTLRSARANREVYVGPWLPEPILETESHSVEDAFEIAQECELALLWAMERLTEMERAAFILREAFDTGYEELAETLGKSEAACRQLVSRAHKRLQESGPRFDAPPDEVDSLIKRFFAAAMAEDFQTALTLLSPDAVAISDGGAKARAARRPLIGPDEILQVFSALMKKAVKEPHWETEFATANGKPAMIRRLEGRIDTITTFAPNAAGQIVWVYVMRNPDKLPVGGDKGGVNGSS